MDKSETILGLAGILVPIIGAIALFTFLAVASWADARRKEREAFYRHETFKKMMEQAGGTSQQILDFLRAEELAVQRRRREGLKLGGLITTAVGLGVIVFLKMIEPDKQVFFVGFIPLFIGVVLLVYGFFMAPNPDGRTSGSLPPTSGS